MYDEKKYSKSVELGNRAEKEFMQAMKKHGFVFRKSEPWEDKKLHIDWYMWNKNRFEGERSIDVKARKSIQRGSAINDIWVCVEFQNNAGIDGWLRGKEDLLAFERIDGFVIVEREPLLILAEKLVDMDSLVFNVWFSKYKLYKRGGNKDRTALIKMDDILTLHTRFVKK